jgi:hypothetical protein
MLKTFARVLLLRVLPRRILPIVTIVEAALFLRSIRRRSSVRGRPSADSRTAPPTTTPRSVVSSGPVTSHGASSAADRPTLG